MCLAPILEGHALFSIVLALNQWSLGEDENQDVSIYSLKRSSTMKWNNLLQQLETLESEREFQPEEDSSAHCLKHNERFQEVR